jgi:hypothetical protein
MERSSSGSSVRQDNGELLLPPSPGPRPFRAWARERRSACAGPRTPLEELPYPFISGGYGRRTGKWHGFPSPCCGGKLMIDDLRPSTLSFIFYFKTEYSIILIYILSFIFYSSAHIFL